MATVYRPAITGPALLVRGKTVSVPLVVYVDSVATAPDSVTCTIERPDQTTIAPTVVVDASGATATASIPAADTLGAGWGLRWAFTYGSDVYEVTQPAECVAYASTYTVSSQDLIARHPELANQYPVGSTTADQFVVVGEQEVEDWLRAMGRRPWRIVPDGALRLPTVYASLSAWFWSLSTEPDDRYAIHAARYDIKRDDALAFAKLSIDLDDDGLADESEQGKTAGPVVIHMSGRY